MTRFRIVISVLIVLFFVIGCAGVKQSAINSADNQSNTQIAFNRSSAEAKDPVRFKKKITATFQMNSKICYINGKEIQMNAFPLVQRNSLYLPIDYLTLALEIPANGAVWSDNKQEVTLKKNNNLVVLRQGYIFLVNGEEIEPLHYARVAFKDESSNMMYVAAFPLAKAFGYDVSWDKDSGRIDVKVGLPLVEEDLSLAKIKVGMDESRVLELLGQPLNIESWRGPSLIKRLSYPDLKVGLFEGTRIYNDQKWRVDSIYTTSPQYQTRRGVRVDDSLEKVIALYGEGYRTEVHHEKGTQYYHYDFLASSDWEKGVSFIITDNRVTGIWVHNKFDPK